MAVYTLFGQAATGQPSAINDSSTYTLGMQFTLSQAATLTGIWWSSPSGATALPAGCAIYLMTGAGTGSIVAGSENDSPSWSGAAGSGWVKCAYGGGPALSPGNTYKVVVLKSAAQFVYSRTADYWSSGAGGSGLTSGIITAPNNAGGDGGQDTFVNPSASLTYPASSFSASNYWVDVEVSTGTSHTATAALTVTPSFSAARTRGRFRTGALTVTPSFSAPSSHAAAVTAAQVRGGWWQLYSIIEYARQEREFYAQLPPMACPRCGEPMRPAPPSDSGSEVELYCLFDGFQFPRDWTRPAF